MKKFFFLLPSLFFTIVFGQMQPMAGYNEPKLEVQNTILYTVNGKTISAIDVIKKMNTWMYQSYPDLYESSMARYQFYLTNWKYVLDEMINTELILEDFKAKEQKIASGEVREEMEKRFGPHILLTLDSLNLTYEEAWDMLKREMIVQRMTGFFVHAKAFHAITPQKIRQAYRLYCDKNPPKETWNYQIITIRSEDTVKAKEIADSIYDLVKNKRQLPIAFENELKTLEEDNVSIQMSKEYEVTNKDISEELRTIFAQIKKQNYSKPYTTQSRLDNKTIHRIYYLKDYAFTPAPGFNDVAEKLKNELLQQEAGVHAKTYVTKLRKQYGIEEEIHLPDNFQPFQLK